MTFQQWLAAVDRALTAKVGLTHRDIADQTWHDWYDADYTPRQAMREALENEGLVL